ncbi:MAG: HupE/UreJ family protein [Synechococcaceae cyanobacterium ELA739]|jgi:urease accessory protein
MKLFSRSPLLALGAGFALSLLSALPAGAHGLASGGLLSGGLHPLLGLDHLLLLVGVGAAAAGIDASLLVFALAGALVGGCFGAFGAALPLAEKLAALSVSAVGLVLLRTPGADRRPGLGLAGAVIAGAVAIHALLHGQAATGELGWWLGAGASSTAVVLVSMAGFRFLNAAWLSRLALGLVLGGGLLALVPVG